MPTAVTNDGVELYYEVHGNEDAEHKIIFIMGLCAPHRAWHLHTIYFANLPNYKVLIFDNRGSGFSYAPPPPYTMTRMAEDVVFLADIVGFQRFHLAGMSMGGMIAQHVALAHPERIASLTLIVTRVEGGFKKNLPTYTGMMRFFRMAVVARTTDQILKAAVDLMFPASFLKQQSQEYNISNRKLMFNQIKQFNHDMPFPTEYVREGQYGAIRSHGLTQEQLQKLKSGKYPILAIVGDKDILVKPSHSYKMPIKIGANLVIIEGAGHGVLNQCPVLVNNILHKHFEQSNTPKKDVPEVLRFLSSYVPEHPFFPPADIVIQS